MTGHGRPITCWEVRGSPPGFPRPPSPMDSPVDRPRYWTRSTARARWRPLLCLCRRLKAAGIHTMVILHSGGHSHSGHSHDFKTSTPLRGSNFNMSSGQLPSYGSH